MSVKSIPSSGGVEAAIRRASTSTGVDFDFLMKTARRESAMNPNARAPTSSASGLFQFIEQTWLATVKRHGAKHGYGQYADLIHQGGDGRWQVRGSARNVVLDLRFDPQAASTMAAELTASNAAYLRGRTGREPGAGDLYAAHFLGPAGAAKLIETVQARPHLNAAALFPEAAAANRSIFYRGGRPATVAEVHANLQRTAGEASPALGVDSPKGPDLSEKDRMLAARLDRLKQDQSLLALLLGQDGEGRGGGFGGAFAPPADKVA
ncbi:lytic transglycosylase domain-containing protein [Brevundimonas naejangsanensis]|uniref:Lytic transglycosylase domain-containing protein n=1 Tax=Brevundimonas naejangsanensis TaxID=588932 RepID=A0A494RQE0_9CAUL|nr:transglycosylase SLT domain-containing protein [Brevundimonas naejangsanensis]AYG95526.1 lytic transglycosylase domain-containing protein [Brevundimonas naejangsanensis]